MSNNLSPELQDQIVREAEAYADNRIMDRRFIVSRDVQHNWDRAKDDYIKAATPYAARWEQAKKVLEKIKEIAKRHGEIRDIINTALSSWKEEGKREVGNG